MAGIYRKPMEIPPESEVLAQRYHYYECPLPVKPPMPSHVFLHYMECARRNLNDIHCGSIFLDRLPKKIGGSILSENVPHTFGWGVHIIEGPNKVALSWALVASIVASFVISVMYAVIAKTQEQGFGIGQWFMAVITAVMAALYFQWMEV